MLERLHFILGSCVGEGTQDCDHIVASNKDGESLKEEGALIVIIILIIVIIIRLIFTPLDATHIEMH